MKLPNLIGPYPQPRHRNHACPGWLVDRWDSAGTKLRTGEISPRNPFPKIPLIARSAGVVALTLLFLASARAQSNFDWKQASGTKLVVMLNKHPYADAIVKRLQEFKDLTGINVGTSETPEENYFDKLTAALASKNGTPDVFMTGTYQLWDYATAGYMEPLDSYLKDPSQTNPEYDYTDIFEGVRNGGKWDLIPGHPS